jgi:hypothetical protein
MEDRQVYVNTSIFGCDLHFRNGQDLAWIEEGP